MNKIGALLTLAVLSLSSVSCHVDADLLDVSTPEELQEKLKAEQTRNQLTSISYCVVKNDSLVYSGALGYADLNGHHFATDTTRYLIASVSKTVTAVALMQLVDQHLITLDDDINNSLPYSIRNPDFPGEAITFRMLLTHTSGISDKNLDRLNLYCYGSDCTMSLEQFCSDIFSASGNYNSADNFSNYSPGTHYDYSNLGYALLGFLVERISQTPFDTYCKLNIFDRLGMSKTEWRLAAIPQAELAVPNSSSIPSGNPHYTFPDYPNGGLRTTVLDLSKFLRAVIQNGTTHGDSILSPAAMAEMKTLQNGSSEQCLCFYYENIYRRTVLGHSGGEMGVTTEMYFDPNTNVGVIVFNNDDDGELNTILSLLFSYGEKQ